jgi:glutaredoxin-like YruB-family protein
MNKIIIYGTEWCGFCHREMQYLEKKNILFEYKDIEKDEIAYNDLMKKLGGGFRGVPVTDIAGEIILGFDQPKIDAAITAHNIKPA